MSSRLALTRPGRVTSRSRVGRLVSTSRVPRVRLRLRISSFGFPTTHRAIRAGAVGGDSSILAGGQDELDTRDMERGRVTSAQRA